MNRGRWLRAVLALGAYIAIAAVYTHPLLINARRAIASDRYDPVLNASILWWNATTIPFSPQWWTPPHFYPSERIAAFTENLVGLAPIATPLYAASGDPLLTYNLTTFLTWPLSAAAVFLLAGAIGVRAGPAFVGGLAFGFAPYRLAQMPHLQVLACFWLPLALAALHLYLRDSRRRWLAVFGVAWLLQSLSNGYFMLFGGVVIGGWLLFFCSTSSTARLVRPIIVAWVLASLPLLPVLLEYKRVHAQYGLTRPLDAIASYGATASAWVQTPVLVSTWGRVLADGGGEANLFPGLTVVVIVAIAILAAARRRRRPEPTDVRHRSLRAALGIVAALCSAVVVYGIVVGPWRLSLGGVTLRVSSIHRALFIAALSWMAFAALGPRRHRIPSTRSPLVFYTAATIAIVIFAMGPQIRSGPRVVMDYAPYRWLMILPGFEGLRVPTRFWMIGMMCLSTAAAVALDALAPARRGWRAAVVLLAGAGALADVWPREFPMGVAPQSWTTVEPAGVGRPLIELPLGPEFDAAATYRAVAHRRRVANGVSGYDPPHYEWLRHALDDRDPAALLALASFGAIDVVVDGATGEAADLERYVRSIPIAERISSDGVRTVYRLTPSSGDPAAVGGVLPVASGRDSRGGPLGAALDADRETVWKLLPQRADDWIEVDLGSEQTVAAVVCAMGKGFGEYPRQLAVEVSRDRATWQTAWQGEGLVPALAGLMRAPRDVRLTIAFSPQTARYVRLRLLAAAEAVWNIADLTLHAPAQAP